MSNRVYINPNFNKMASTNLLIPNNKMHVNPNFSLNAKQSRIYVNPHFIKPSVNVAPSQNEMCYGSAKEISKNSLTTSNNISLLPHITSRSRYSLVRNTATQGIPEQSTVRTIVGPINKSNSGTIKVNKYKSVAISDYRRKLDIKESQQDSNKPSYKVGQHLDKNVIPPKLKKSFQYLGGSNCSQSNIRSRFKLRNISFDSIRNDSTSSLFKSRVKRTLKKNNIPCPLFKKYGKCLRSTHGTCEFLHDKKHVSICRKFMKGICHDKDCLLSHEITSKKMPTCYFYLKGMCVKENCPYVHVKLNEKTKVCLEFLKGYCEKGDSCLNRHVSNYQAIEKNKVVRKIVSSSKNKVINNKAIVNKYKNIYTKNSNKMVLPSPAIDVAPNNSSHADNRYYKDQQTSANIVSPSEILKPSRCKLGTLPSFIKL